MRVFFAEYLSGLADGPLDAGLRAQGVGMRDAVLADLRAIAACDAGLQVGCAVSAQAPLPAGLRGVRALSRAAGESAFDFVRRQALAHDVVWLIAPESDDILARLSEAVPPSRWLGCDTASIRLTTSKARTTARLHTQGVLTPQAFADDLAVAAWVVKPDDGVGASGARRHIRRADAEADAAQRPGTVLEPWVDGPAMSLSMLCAVGRAELWSVNRQSIAIDEQGWLVEHGVQALSPEPDPALRRLAQQVARALPGLFGWVGIDYVAHATQGPVLIEVNPRVTSAYAGLVALSPRSPARAALDVWATREGSPPAR